MLICFSIKSPVLFLSSYTLNSPIVPIFLVLLRVFLLSLYYLPASLSTCNLYFNSCWLLKMSPSHSVLDLTSSLLSSLLCLHSFTFYPLLLHSLKFLVFFSTFTLCSCLFFKSFLMLSFLPPFSSLAYSSSPPFSLSPFLFMSSHFIGSSFFQFFFLALFLLLFFCHTVIGFLSGLFFLKFRHIINLSTYPVFKNWYPCPTRPELLIGPFF